MGDGVGDEDVAVSDGAGGASVGGGADRPGSRGGRGIDTKVEWAAVAPAGENGLVPFQSSDGRRMLCAVRGGISWPWPRRIGRRIVARGAVAIIGFEPNGGATLAHLVRWAPADTVDVQLGPDGWPASQGVAGEIRTGAMSLRCWKFTGWAGENRQWPVLKQVREMLRDMRPVPAIGDVLEPEPHEADATVARWAGRLELQRDALTQIGLEESEDTMGIRPLTEAVAAALAGYEESPWRPPPEKKWRPVSVLRTSFEIDYSRR